MHFDLDALKKRHEKSKIALYNQKGKRDQILEQKKGLEKELRALETHLDTLEKVRILLKTASEYAREHSREQIEAFVTHCLQFIFDANIEFKIEISEVRGRPEAEFYVVTHLLGESIKTRPQEARGGGIIDIISLALRIAMLECSSLNVEGPLILDEPAKHLSDEYTNQVAEFLKQMSKMYQRQVIMVTHNKHLSEIADKCFRVEMEDGESRVLPNNSTSM